MAKRSVTLHGHRTSISLEPEFWEVLKQVADARQISVNALIAEIDQARVADPSPRNLSSTIRVFVLKAVAG